MTEREKIINIAEQNKYCDINTVPNCEKCKYSKELENYKDMGCGSLKAADALIAANIGDVTAWKERAEKEKAEKNKWKCTANDWKQRFESREKQLGELRTTSCDVVIRKNKIISEQKAEIARLTAENAELRARLDRAVELPRIIHPNPVEWHIQYQYESGIITEDIRFSEAEAEARLKELQGGER